MMDYVVLTAIDGFFAREVEKCPRQEVRLG